MTTDLVLLSVDETDRLHELELVVDRHREGFLEVLAALEEIKASGLYRATSTSFKNYLKERFGFSSSYASRLRSAGAVVEEARRLTGKVDHGQPPTERAVREVTDLPVEEAAAVLVKATAEARAEGRDVPTVGDVRKAREVLRPEVEAEVEDAPEELVTDYTWPKIARAIKPFVDTASGDADRCGVLVGLADLRHDLLLEWGRAGEGPLEQAIRTLEHVAARSDEEFLEHRDERKDDVQKLERLLSDYRQRARRLEEMDRRLVALVPGSIWQRPSRGGYWYLHVDRIDEKGIVWFRKDDAPKVVDHQRREAFLEKATIASFNYGRDSKRRGENLRATFAAAIADEKAKVFEVDDKPRRARA